MYGLFLGSFLVLFLHARILNHLLRLDRSTQVKNINKLFLKVSPLIRAPVLGKFEALCQSLQYTAGNTVEDILSLCFRQIGHALGDLIFALLQLFICKVKEILVSNLKYLVSFSLREGIFEVSSSQLGDFRRDVKERAEPE
jgi:hypothetical protein